MTLLEKAKQSKINKVEGDLAERTELSLAWLADEISGVQVAAALGINGNAVHQRMGNTLISAYRAGIIKIERAK